MKLILLIVLNVLANAIDESIRFQIIDTRLSQDSLNYIESNVKKEFAPREGALKALIIKKNSKIDREIRHLQSKLDDTKSNINKMGYKNKIARLNQEKKELPKWYKKQLKRLQEEQALKLRREESVYRVNSTNKELKIKLDDLREEYKIKPTEQLSYDISIIEGRYNASLKQLNEIQERRKQQTIRQHKVDDIRIRINELRRQFKVDSKKILKKIHELKKAGNKKEEIESLKEELNDLRDMNINLVLNEKQQLHHQIRKNEQVDLSNARIRRGEMSGIKGKVRIEIRKIKRMIRDKMTCPHCRVELKRRLRYYKWMYDKIHTHQKEIKKSIIRHKKNIVIETEAVKKIQVKRFQLLNEQKEVLMERNEKNKMKINKFIDDITHRARYDHKKVIIERRLKLVDRQLRRIIREQLKERKIEYNHLRKQIKGLRIAIFKKERITKKAYAKINYFKRAILQTKDARNRMEWHTKMNILVKRQVKVDEKLKSLKKKLEFSLVKMNDLIHRIINKANKNIEFTMKQQKGIKAEMKKLTKELNTTKDNEMKKQIREDLVTLKVKLLRVNERLNNLKNDIINIRIRLAYLTEKDRYTMKRRNIRKLNMEINLNSVRINKASSKITKIMQRNSRLSPRQKGMIKKLRQRIAYDSEVIEELYQLRRRLLKKIKFRIERLTVLTKNYFDKVAKERRELLERKHRILPRMFDEVDNSKQKTVLVEMKYIESNMFELNREFARLEKQLKELRKDKLMIRDLLKRKSVCKDKGSCPMCLDLGNIMKKGLFARKSDRTILGEMKYYCSKKIPVEQKTCYNTALKMGQAGFKGFDPLKFNPAVTCQKIGLCSI